MTKKEKSFEEAMTRLEQIVADLESGELTLEQTLAIFEEAIQLTRFCEAKLSQAEDKLKVLVKDGNQFIVKPGDL